MIEDLFAAWTLMGIAVALASGIVLGEVGHQMHLLCGWRPALFAMVVVGVLWYIPVNVRLAIDPDMHIASVWRNVSGGLLWFAVYMPAAVIWSAWRDRRKEED